MVALCLTFLSFIFGLGATPVVLRVCLWLGASGSLIVVLQVSLLVETMWCQVLTLGPLRAEHVF